VSGRFAGPFAAFAALGVFWGGWAVLVPTVQTAVGASKAALGLALLGIAVGSLPAMLAYGRGLARLLPRPLPVALLLLAAAGVLPGLAGSVPALGLALVATGAASGLLDVAMNTEVAALEAETGTRRMQLAHALYSLGVIGGAVVCGILRQEGVGRLGILGVLGGIIVAAALPNASRPPREVEPAAPAPFRFRRVLVVAGAISAAAFVVEGGIETWSALFLQRELDAGAALSSTGPAAYATAMATGRLLGQRLTGRIGDRVLLAVGGIVSAGGLLLACTAPSVAVAAVGFFAGGAGVSVAAPIFFGAAGRSAPPAERGQAVATVTTLGYVGFLVGPPLVGGIAQALGLRASFALLALLALLLAGAAPRLAFGSR
jgi:predicted MFS family arabinose efflux permease